jgi:Uridine kinase
MELIKITIDGETRLVAKGTRIRDMLDKGYLPYDRNPAIGATVCGELVSLSAALTSDAEVSLIPLFSQFGKRIYRHSICFLFAYAVKSVCPDKHLEIGHSQGDGYYYDTPFTQKELDGIRAFMKEAVKNNLPIYRVPLSYKNALKCFSDGTWKQTESLLESRNDNRIIAFRIGDYTDLSYEPLADYAGVLSLWRLDSYRNGALLRYPQARDFSKLQNFADYPLLFDVFESGHAKEKLLGVECVGDLNRKIADGETDRIIELEEALMNRNISDIAKQIGEHKKVKIVTIAGPSSSGKTTFSLKLCTQLALLGFNCIKISLDDYYLTKDKVPMDKDGKPDFEALEALDLDLIHTQLTELLAGKAVKLPIFSFKENKRYWAESETQLEENSLLILEGIHGLNPKLLSSVPAENIFKIYISALTSVNIDDHNRISTTDNRIIRRIVRDHRTRGTSATDTLAMWPSVEAGEKLHIFPFQNQADAMYNSAHTYELAALAPYAESLLRSVKPDSGAAYTTARRLLQFIELFYAIPADSIPANSLVREFIGGSMYKAV